MTENHRNMLNELLAYHDDKLSDWDVDWITHLDRWVANLNVDQAKMLKLVWTKVFG